jgi:hypothetical protein
MFNEAVSIGDEESHGNGKKKIKQKFPSAKNHKEEVRDSKKVA